MLKEKQIWGIDMKRNNSGMSLVEVIIVVAILSIVAGGITLGIGFITRKPADECANKLRAALQSNRTTTMGKLSAELEIFGNSDGVWVVEIVDGTEKNPTRIGSSGVNVEVKVSDGSSYILDTGTPVQGSPLPSTPLKLSFNRSTGAFNPLPGGGYCTEIVISKGSLEKTLKLYYLTGKIELQ